MIILNHKNFYTIDFLNELLAFGCETHPELKVSKSQNFITRARENSELLKTLFDLYVKENNVFII